jgi:WXG100 family type VII secretion target
MDMGAGAAMVKCDYDMLKSVAQEFRKAADNIAKMNQDIKSKYEPLAGGQWLGQGAKVFKGEMEGEVLPTLTRLQAALSQAAEVTGQIDQLIQGAEQEASHTLSVFPG